MYNDGNRFHKRATFFLAALKAGTCPTARWLSQEAKCSLSTAHRTIAGLISDYAAPIYYDKTRHGYVLREMNFELLAAPPKKDELAALLLVRNFAKLIDSPELHSHLDSLWEQCVTTSMEAGSEVIKLANFFSADLTAVSVLRNVELFSLVKAASCRSFCLVTYQSPWRHVEPHVYRGVILRLRYSDGALYLWFCTKEGRHITLNASNIISLEVLENKAVNVQSREETNVSWARDQFGIWVGERVEDVEIKINPPGAKWFAAQRWCEEQEDLWESDVLVRRMRAVPSPELVRRILSLGSHVAGIKPESLRQTVQVEARKIVEGL